MTSGALEPKPPRLPRLLLAKALPREDTESVLDDLDEDFTRRQRDEGRVPATMWYYRECLAMVFWLGVMRRSSRQHTREISRRDRGWRLDLVYAVRRVWRDRRFTFASAISIGIGVATAATVFAAIDVFVLRPLPFPNADDLVVFHGVDSVGAWLSPARDPSELSSLQSQMPSTRLAGYESSGVSTTGGMLPETVSALHVSTNFFAILGVAPGLGRGFIPGDGNATESVVLVSNGFAKAHFGSVAEAVGARIELDDRVHTVVGVMPASFDFDGDAECWLPLGSKEEWPTDRALRVLGRLREGSSMQIAVEELRRAQSRHAARQVDWLAVPLQREWFDEEYRYASALLSVAGLLVLVVAGTNVASLNAASLFERREEIKLRRALGARSWRIARELILEAMIVSAVACCIALAATTFGARWFRSLIPADWPGISGITIQWRVVVFTAVAGSVTGVVAACFPVVSALRSAHRPQVPLGITRMRRFLSTAQVAVALVTVVSAALLVRAYDALRRTDLGFDRSNVLTARIELTSEPYGRNDLVVAFQQRLLRSLRASASIRSVGLTSHLPTRGSLPSWYEPLDGVSGSAPERRSLRVIGVSPGYFETMKIPIVQGGELSWEEPVATLAPIVVNQRIAATMATPTVTGKTVRTREGLYGIAGVVGDVRIRGPENDYDNMAFVPLSQIHARDFYVVVRGTIGVAALTEQLRRDVASIDGTQAVSRVESMDEVIAGWLNGPAALANLFSAFGAIALTVALIGVYAMFSREVEVRRCEIGVRVALGARRQTIVRMLVGEGIRVGSVGAAIGLVLAVVSTKMLGAVLYGFPTFDPIIFGGVAAIVIAAVAVATLGPGLIASEADPAMIVRQGQ